LVYSNSFFGINKFLSVGDKSPDWKELFQSIIPQFVAMKENPITIDFSDFTTTVPANPQKYKERNIFYRIYLVSFFLFQVRILEILADNLARADILYQKKPPGYNCCPLCLSKVYCLFIMQI
jgi:hypothetical protein